MLNPIRIAAAAAGLLGAAAAHARAVDQIAWRPDGAVVAARVAAAAAGPADVLLFDGETGKPKGRVGGDHALAIAWSSTNVLAVSEPDATTLYDGATMKPLRTLTGGYRALSFSPDGRYLTMWRPKDAGNLLVTVDTSTGENVWVHEKGESDPEWTLDGLLVGVGIEQGGRAPLVVREGATGKPLAERDVELIGMNNLDVSDSGAAILSTASPSGAEGWAWRVWTVPVGGERTIGVLEPQDQLSIDAALSVAVSNDGKWHAVGSRDGQVVAWADPATLHRKQTGKPVAAIAFSPDGQRLAIDAGKKIIVWEIKASP